MAIFLWIVTLGSYAMALLAFAVGKSDIQLIAAGVYATCGTVAMVGASVISRLPPPPPPKDLEGA
jgi:hypothetical protein